MEIINAQEVVFEHSVFAHKLEEIENPNKLYIAIDEILELSDREWNLQLLKKELTKK